VSVPARRLPDVPVTAGPARGAEGLRRPEGAEGAERPPRSATAPVTPGSRIRRRRKHTAGFAALTTVVVGLMVLGIVSLNALLAQTSFHVDEAERRIADLSQEHLELVREQAQLSAPGRIAEWARRNGMRLPDDIRSLHASGDLAATPAGAADPAGGR
jgi:cell division protein FtsL